jgi:DNA-binding sugar fermentation-stimulating protein
VVFVVQRDDVRRLRPFAKADPAFARALGEVVNDGVEAYAIACVVARDSLTPVRLVPIEDASGVPL